MILRLSPRVLAPLAVIVLCYGCGRSGPEPPAGSQQSMPGRTNGVESGAAPPSGPPVPESGGDVDPGHTVYVDHCMRCHGETGLGDGPDAASLYKRPANLQEHVGHHSDKDLANVVRNGRAPMPAFGHLGEQDIADLISYLRKLAPSTEHSGHSR